MKTPENITPVPTTTADALPKSITPTVKKCPITPGPCIRGECTFYCSAGCAIPAIVELLLEQKNATTRGAAAQERAADTLEDIQEQLAASGNL